jgi:molecular chaperone DnaJ
MIKKDYYEVLKIEKDADNGVIKAAYRKLALQYHPDRNPGDYDAEEFFKEASEAYEVLSDPQKRQIYNNYGHQGLEGTGFSGFGGMDDIFSSFGDIFEDFFGGFGGFGQGARGSRPRKGADLRYDLDVTFEESAFGVEKEVKIRKAAGCDICEGSGVEPGTSREHCDVCGGTGQIQHRQGFFMIQSGCAKCGGSGSFVSHPCKECRGKGRVMKEKKLSVKVPAGVEDGMRLVLRGEGEVGHASGPPGDMYVFLSVRPHKHFGRKGNDIYYKLEIGFPEASLGVEVKVPTLYGSEKISIPSGIQSGDTVRVKGKGVPDVHGGKKGNQIVIVSVVTPRKLSRKQKKLLEDFVKESK